MGARVPPALGWQPVTGIFCSILQKSHTSQNRQSAEAEREGEETKAKLWKGSLADDKGDGVTGRPLHHPTDCREAGEQGAGY